VEKIYDPAAFVGGVAGTRNDVRFEFSLRVWLVSRALLGWAGQGRHNNNAPHVEHCPSSASRAYTYLACIVGLGHP
jgi:hypothetical protein